MKIIIDDKYEFVPEWNGNREDENPIKFYCRYLTVPERARVIQKNIEVGGESAAVLVNYKEKEIFDLSVIRIENLEVNGKKIATATDFHLSSSGLGGLFDECVQEFIQRNVRRELKN